MNRPFVQMIYDYALNNSPDAIAAHQAKRFPSSDESFKWLKIEVPLVITFDSPPCTSFSSESALRRLAAKYGSNYIQNVGTETQETSRQ